MVDKADLARITTLYDEIRQIRNVVDNFDNGGRIISMTVSGGQVVMPDTPNQIPPPIYMPRAPATIHTLGLEYPPQMVDAIKSALNARRNAINAELEQLGVTGPDEEPTATSEFVATTAPPTRPPPTRSRS